MKSQYAIIMAGGVGSRFWPVSRSSYPKQFIDIMGTGQTLLQGTYNRFLNIIPKENIFILTNDRYRTLVKEQLDGIADHNILGEPAMRNTAPCIAYACTKINTLDPDAVIVIAPSDHLISNEQNFSEAITSSLKAAAANEILITLGIQPSRADTGYGYIQFGAETLAGEFKKVQRFTEKPVKELAEEFVASGAYLWNAGIFVWSAREVLKAFEHYVPEMYQLFKAGEAAYNTAAETAFLEENYPLSENISIDYAIMEKAANVYVLPVEFGWSDLGTWSSVYTLAEKDPAENVLINPTNTIIYDTSGCMINISAGKKIIVKGLHDFIIAESNDTILICPKSCEQEVKQFVTDAKTSFGPEYA